MADNEGALISSVRNQRVVEARKLRQRKHRQRQGRFLVEDRSSLQMALDAGARPLEAFYCESQLVANQAIGLLNRLRQTNAELVAVSPRVMEALTERQAPLGLVATFGLFEASLRDVSVGTHGLVVIVDRLQDPGNLGTLIRTADAVGASAVILIEPCVDPFDPKTVRGSMGSLFNIPLVRTSNLAKLFGWIRSNGLLAVGTDAQLGKPWGERLLESGVALILGNEARGLSDDVQPFVDGWASLPIVGKAESLNVAVAGGVLMYFWLRLKLGDYGSHRLFGSF